jgi:predicted transglutaminase-like cysteine proteinase
MREEILHPASAHTASQSAAGAEGPRSSARLACAALAAAFAGLLALAAPAQAQQAPRAMALGAVTAPPPGYLDFCARMPAECGLAAQDDQGRPRSAAALRGALYHQYFWASAFGPGAAANAVPPPASGDAGADDRHSTDWNAIFGSAAAPAQIAEATPALLTADTPAASDAPLIATPALMAQLDRVNLQVNRAIRYVSDRILYGDEDYWHLAIGPDGKGAGDCKDYVLEKHKALIAAGVPASDLSIAIVSTTWGETHAILLVRTDRGELVMDSLSQWIQPWTKVHYKWIKRQAPGQQLTWVSLS